MISKPPGIVDIFPDTIDRWNHIINTARDVFSIHNYKEIIIPILEFTEVFARGLGDETDIVSKEMFTFEDRGGRSLTLRPEGTASVVRAYVENGNYNRLSSSKFYYNGPMFRAERPQKGRLRQFNQFGAEFFGSNHPYYDFEIISVMDTISKRLGISGYKLLVNSIGCASCREDYIKDLVLYYSNQSENLCEDCKKRLSKNPLRLLDCKNEGCVRLKDKAPQIAEYLCKDCEDHHNSLKGYLDKNKIEYINSPNLVRGLDYYTRTTFEFVTGDSRSQNAFAAGGRYDNLVELFGGKPTPAVGFAAGIERIFILIENIDIPARKLGVCIAHSGDNSIEPALLLSSMLRSKNFSVDIDPESKGLKSQLKKADRENAKFVIIIGDDEIASNKYSVKNMSTGSQESIDKNMIVEYLIENNKKI